MRVTLQMASADLPADGEQLRSARALVERFGLRLEPLFPGASDRKMSAFFVVQVPDRQTANQLIEAVTARHLADRAYVKPDPHLA